MNSSAALPPDVQTPSSQGKGESELGAECAVFTRYLTGRAPADYVLRKFRDGHLAIPYRTRGEEDAFDVALAIYARRSAFRARIGDAYARVYRPHGVLRQKLTLLLAILENSPPDYREFTSGGRGMVMALLSIAGGLASFGLALAAGHVVLGPMHLLLRGRKLPRKAPA